MHAVGASELLLLMLLGGGLSNDLVSLLDAQRYFQSRNIPITVEKMVDLATREPSDGKAQIQQLLALRQLRHEAAQVKKAANFGDILKQVEGVAKGQKAQDPQGFAAAYAQATAQTLGSQLKPERAALPEGSAVEAVSWFPKSAQLVFSIDSRGGPITSEASKLLSKLMGKAPPEALDQLYGMIEKLGNVQVDRFALGLVMGQDSGPEQIYLRLTGKTNRKWLLELLREKMPNANVVEDRAGRGPAVTRLGLPDQPPAFAIIGDSELLIAGPKQRGDSMKLIEQMLAIRAGKEKSVQDGELGGDLKKVSTRAAGLIVGDLNEQMRRGLSQLLGGAQPPRRLVAEATRKEGDLHLQARGTLDTPEDARMLVEQLTALQKTALASLKNPPPLPADAPVPADIFKRLTRVVESVKVESQEKSITAAVTAPLDLLQLGPAFLFAVERGGPIPPPPIKIEEKK